MDLNVADLFDAAALARRFAAAGMRVAIGDIEVDAIDSTVDVLGGDGDRVVGVRCDVRSITDVAWRDGR